MPGIKISDSNLSTALSIKFHMGATHVVFQKSDSDLSMTIAEYAPVQVTVILRC